MPRRHRKRRPVTSEDEGEAFLRDGVHDGGDRRGTRHVHRLVAPVLDRLRRIDDIGHADEVVRRQRLVERRIDHTFETIEDDRRGVRALCHGALADKPPRARRLAAEMMAPSAGSIHTFEESSSGFLQTGHAVIDPWIIGRAAARRAWLSWIWVDPSKEPSSGRQMAADGTARSLDSHRYCRCRYRRRGAIAAWAAPRVATGCLNQAEEPSEPGMHASV